MTNHFQNFLEKNNLVDKVNTHFKKYSVMLDVARGRVLSLAYLKQLLINFSHFGINEVWLYVEDLLDIKQPFFGYLRGKYTLSELQELDSFAQELGIEMVFSIQTLGHFEQFLHWQKACDYRDTQDILLANDEKTYELINKMVNFCKTAFSSKRIHIGLDETFSLGKGAYINYNGYTEPAEIYQKHLEKVKEIVTKAGYTDVLVWSDMIISHSTKNKGYYQIEELLVDKQINCKQLTLVYWDYYNDNVEKINNNLDFHKQLSDKVIFATGVWTFQRPIVDVDLSKKTVSAAVKSCQDKQIDEICITSWNDNGGYCDPDDIVTMLPFITSKIYNIDINLLKRLYTTLTSKNLDDDLAKTVVNELGLSAIAIIYDDPIYGIYLNNYFNFKKDLLDTAISKLKNFKIDNYKKDTYFYSMFQIVNLKLQARKYFLDHINDNKALLKLTPLLKKLVNAYKQFLHTFEQRWANTSKENGLEIHQLRLSGLITRTKHFIKLISKKTDFTKIVDQVDVDYDVDNRFSSVFSPTIFLV